MRLIIAFLFISTFSFAQTYVIKSVDDVKGYTGGPWISVGSGDPEEDLKLYDEILNLISEKFDEQELISETSKEIHKRLDKPNPMSTLRNKFNTEEWKRYVDDYKIDIDPEDYKEPQLIQALLNWRKEN